MEHSNPTLAKILILDTGKFEQWKFRIQQYLQNEHYALWEVIEFGDSCEAPQDDAATGTTEGTETLEQTFNRLQAIRNRSDLDTMSLDDLYNHLKVYEPEVQKKPESNSQNMGFISSAKNSSGNGEVNTTSIPTASAQVSPAGPNVATASISLDTTCAYIASQSNGKFPTGNSKLSTVDLGNKGKAIKASACWIWKPKQNSTNKGNISYLSDYEPYDEGYVSFGQGDTRLPVKELSKLNNIDDKGYWDSGFSRHMTGNISYLSDYEPYDEGYVSFGQGDTRLPVKELLQLTMNKLVRHNLVRGLPSKCFENDHTCVAYLKGKQHKASCKTKKGIKTEFNNVRTPQQNGVAERRNRTLIEAARTMLVDAKLPVTFWVEVVNTACYVQNRVLVNKSQNKTPYELFNGKFEAKGDDGYFIGYSMSSKAFRVFNKRTKRVKENLHVEFLENKLIEKGDGLNWLFDIDTLTNSMNYVPVVSAGTISTNFSGTKEAASQDVKKDVSSLRYIALPNWFHEAHLETSTSNAQDACKADAPESSGNFNPTATSTNPPADQMETLTVKTLIPTVSSPILTACLDDSPQLSSDSHGVEADLSNMENNISTSPTPTLRIRKDHPTSQIIGPVDTPIQTRTKSKKMEEQSFIASIHHMTNPDLLQNKARLVAQGHTHKEGINYEEVFALVARIEAIRLFLAYASFIGFTIYQLDVNSAFLYGTIDEEVYVVQPPGFQDPEEFEALMHEKFQMSAMGELNFFLGLQVLQKKDGIFLSQDKYVSDILKKVGYSDVRHQVTPKECHLHAVKRIFRYLKGHPKLGIWEVPVLSCEYWNASSLNILAFCDYHNMIAILEKYEHNVDFHQIVDFVEASHIRYALAINPTVYVSHIRQFWSTDRVETSDEETKILATVDGKPRTISESSIRRNLKLKDEAGMSSLLDVELFENLTLMGSKSTGFNEFSSNIATAVAPQSPQHDLSSSIHPPVTTAIIPTVILTDNPPLRQYSRRARIAPSLTIPTAADEPASPLGDDSQGEACLIVFGLEAEQDRANIIKTYTLPHDSTPRVTSLAADEGSMQQQLDELTDLCTRLKRQQTEMASKITTQDLEIASLKARIKLLKDKDRGVAKTSREDVTIKERSLETGEEAAVENSTEKDSNDTKELVNVLTSLDAARILTSGGVQVVSVPPATEGSTVSVPTGSGMVPTASPIFTTASVVTPYSRRKGKEKMVESDTPKKKRLQEQIDVQMAREMEEQMAREDQRMNEQIARDADIARIHAKEELQMLIDSLDRNNETVAKYLQEYEQFAANLSIGERIELINDLVKYQDNYAKVLKYQSQQRKPLSKKQQREFYISVLKSHSGWKAKHFKGMSLEEIREKFIPVWKQIEDVIPIEEVSEEDLKTMMQLVPVKEVYVEALQVKHPIIDWEIHTEGNRTYWKIIRLGGNTTVYQFFVDMLKHFDREDLNQLSTLVKETLSIRQATSDKEELWVELTRLYEPDVKDQLWT
nr:hypothetical protein [Tanacetum cinerariifolium]